MARVGLDKTHWIVRAMRDRIPLRLGAPEPRRPVGRVLIGDVVAAGRGTRSALPRIMRGI